MSNFIFLVQAWAGFAIGLCLTMLAIEELYYRIGRYFCRKESAIFSLAMDGFWENSEIILFDDSVEGMVLTIPKFNVKISIINVNEGKIND